MEDSNNGDSDDDSVGTAATEEIDNDDDALYENGNEIPSQNEIEMWQNRSTGCLKELCDWSQLHSNVIGLMNSSERERDDVRVLDLMVSGGLTPEGNHLRDRLFPSYICSLAHSGKSKKEEFSEFISEGLQGNENVRTSIESYPCDVAVCFALRNDWSRVKVYTEKASIQFIERWRALHPCAREARKGLLQGIQRIVELDEAAHFHTSSSSSFSSSSSSSSSFFSNLNSSNKFAESQSSNIPKIEKNLSGLLKKWKNSRPNVADPIWIWDEIIVGRKVSLENSDESYNNEILKHLSQLHIATASAGVFQNNLQTVHPQLTESNQLKKAQIVKSNNLSVDEIKIVCEFNKKNMKNKSYSEADNSYERTLNLLTKTTENGVHDRIPLLLIQGEWLSRWAEFEKSHYRKNNNDNRITDKPQWVIKNSQALDAYVTASNMCNSTNNYSNVNVSTALRTETYGKLAKFCEQQLRELESELEDDEGVVETDESLRRTGTGTGRKSSRKEEEEMKNVLHRRIQDLSLRTVQSFVNGLILENNFCRDRLLRLVELTGKYPHTASSFTTSLSSIPTWLFLKFSPQLMGILDLPQGKIAAIILRKVAMKYPHACFYPFNISKEFLGPKGQSLCNQCVDLGSSLEFGKPINSNLESSSISGISSGLGSSVNPLPINTLNSKLNQKQERNDMRSDRNSSINMYKNRVSLSELLKDSASEAFVTALGGLTHPELRWNDGMKAINKICGLDMGKALSIFEDLHDTNLSLQWANVRTVR